MRAINRTVSLLFILKRYQNHQVPVEASHYVALSGDLLRVVFKVFDQQQVHAAIYLLLSTGTIPGFFFLVHVVSSNSKALLYLFSHSGPHLANQSRASYNEKSVAMRANSTFC